MSGKANSESVFSSKEALGAVRLVALALRCADEINDDDRLAAASILKEAHFTLESERGESGVFGAPE